jgi:hypothetical protein
MDVKVQWKISDDVDGLIAAVVECKHQLLRIAAEKLGRDVKQISCDAYAAPKILELFQLSANWVPVVEFSEEDMRVPVHRRQKKTTELVADFGLFKLHRMDVLGTRSVRVIAAFEGLEGGADQVLFGDVELVK